MRTIFQQEREGGEQGTRVSQEPQPQEQHHCDPGEMRKVLPIKGGAGRGACTREVQAGGNGVRSSGWWMTRTGTRSLQAKKMESKQV